MYVRRWARVQTLPAKLGIRLWLVIENSPIACRALMGHSPRWRRCLRPGGRLVGSTFLAEGSRRQRRLLRADDFGRTGTAEDLRGWLLECGLTDVSVDRDDGLAVFSARRPS